MSGGPARELEQFDDLAHWLDDRFRLPGTQIRFGLDGLLGLVPGIGDSATALTGGYIILRAARLGVPAGVLARMALNVGIDWLVGLVPLVGDLFDFGFKSHRRNVALVRRHLGAAAGDGR